jgi:WD40 repeat protein
MKRYLLFFAGLILFLALPICLQSQPPQEESYFFWREKAMASFTDGLFETAVREFKVAQICTDAPKPNDTDEWIDKAYSGYVEQLKKEKAFARSTALAAKSLLASQKDHDRVRGFQYAKYAWREAQLPEALSALYAAAFQEKNPLYRSLDGHRLQVHQAAFTPDGKWILTASFDQTLMIRDSAGNQIAILKMPPGDFIRFRIAPDSKRIVAWINSYNGNQSNIRMWNYRGQAMLDESVNLGGIHDIRFSPDGKSLLIASGDNKLHLWTAWPTGGEVFELASWEVLKITSARFLPDSSGMVTANPSGLRLWSAEGELRKEVKSLGNWELLEIVDRSDPFLNFFGEASFAPIPGTKILAWDHTAKKAMVWIPDGDTFASGENFRLYGQLGAHGVSLLPFGEGLATISGTFWGRDHKVEFYDLEGNPIMEPLSHQGWIHSLSFSPNGKQLLAAAEDGSARLWDFRPPPAGKGELLYSLEGHSRPVNAAVFSPDPSFILTASDDHTARLWDLRADVRMKFQNPQLLPIRDAIWSAGSEWLVLLPEISVRMPLQAWNPSKGSTAQIEFLDGGDFTTAAFSPDQKRVAAGAFDGTLRIWSIDGELLHTEKAHESALDKILFHPSGNYLLSMSAMEGSVKAWNTTPGSNLGRLIKLIDQDANGISRIALSADGNKLAVSFHNKIARIFDARPGATLGNLILTLEGHQADLDDVTFSSDGKWIATASRDRTAVIWDQTGNRMLEITHTAYDQRRGFVRKVAFSTEGNRFLTATDDSTFIWEIQPDAGFSRRIATLEGTNGRFSANSNMILTQSTDHALLWSADGDLLFTFGAANQKVMYASFSPDGKFVVTDATDGRITLWPVDPDVLISKMDKLNISDLSREEKEKAGINPPE